AFRPNLTGPAVIAGAVEASRIATFIVSRALLSDSMVGAGRCDHPDRHPMYSVSDLIALVDESPTCHSDEGGSEALSLRAAKR
ncbi:MAG: hypothetical protein M3Q50_04900, partial [Chloroflexota bacterium]|nr:hypothetical protein [Chloroflexota bacterium]